MSSLARMIAAADTAVVLQDAVEAALHLRVGDVQRQLPYEFLDEHAERSLGFFARWVPRLEPLEQLQASDWVARECLTSLVHAPDAYGTGARIHLSALASAAQSLAGSLEDFAALTEGPDAAVAPAAGATTRALADRVRRVHEELVALASSPADGSGDDGHRPAWRSSARSPDQSGR